MSVKLQLISSVVVCVVHKLSSSLSYLDPWHTNHISSFAQNQGSKLKGGRFLRITIVHLRLALHLPPPPPPPLHIPTTPTSVIGVAQMSRTHLQSISTTLFPMDCESLWTTRKGRGERTQFLHFSISQREGAIASASVHIAIFSSSDEVKFMDRVALCVLKNGEELDDFENTSVIAAAAKWESSVSLNCGPGWSRKDNACERTLLSVNFKSLWILNFICFSRALFSWISNWIILMKVQRCLETSQICSCLHNFRWCRSCRSAGCFFV